MRHAVLRAACFSPLGAALVHAAPAVPVRKAAKRGALSRLGAALLLTPPAPAVRDAVLRAVSSPLGAALVLAALSFTAPTMHVAVLLSGSSNSETARLLAAFAPAVRLAELCGA